MRAAVCLTKRMNAKSDKWVRLSRANKLRIWEEIRILGRKQHGIPR